MTENPLGPGTADPDNLPIDDPPPADQPGAPVGPGGRPTDNPDGTPVENPSGGRGPVPEPSDTGEAEMREGVDPA